MPYTLQDAITTGNTAGRPVTPGAGHVYHNIQTQQIEQWSGAAWVVLFDLAIFTETTELTTHTSNVANPHVVTKTQVGLSEVANLKNNYTAIVAPTTGDDSGDGYAVGSFWYNVSTDRGYVLLDATVAAAVWKETTYTEVDASGDFGPPPITAVTNPTINDDQGDGYIAGQVWLNTATDEAWVCLDASTGAAVWKLLTTRGQAIFTVEGAVAVTTGRLRLYNQLGIPVTITEVFLSIDTAPTGTALIVDIHKGGVTIFTTQANRPQVAIGANSGNTTTVDVPAWADGEYLTMDTDQIGSTVAGSDLVVHVIYRN